MLVNFDARKLFSLSGKTALVTGASGFLGRTFVRALLSNGARVVALGRSPKLKALEQEWGREFTPSLVRVEQVDMYNNAALEKKLKSILQTEKIVDVLVNNAHEMGPATGFNTSEGHLDKAPFEQWMKHLKGGVYWAAQTTRVIGGGMVKRKKGSIINISSMYGLVAPNPALYEGTKFMNPPGYSAAKAGLLALTRYTASFWGMHNVRANALLPGAFSNTEDKTGNSVKKGDPFLNKLNQRTVLRRTGRAEELVGPLVFLASDASSYMTGHALVVDGGWTIT